MPDSVIYLFIGLMLGISLGVTVGAELCRRYEVFPRQVRIENLEALITARRYDRFMLPEQARADVARDSHGTMAD